MPLTAEQIKALHDYYQLQTKGDFWSQMKSKYRSGAPKKPSFVAPATPAPAPSTPTPATPAPAIDAKKQATLDKNGMTLDPTKGVVPVDQGQPKKNILQQAEDFIGKNVIETKKQAGSEMQAAADRQTSGKQTILETGAQGATASLGAAFNIALNVAKPVVKGVLAVDKGIVETIAPEQSKQVEDALAKAKEFFSTNPVAQKGLALLGSSVQKYNDWVQKNPRVAADINAAVTLGTTFIGGKAGTEAIKAAGEKAVAEIAAKGAVKKVASKDISKLAEYTAPKLTPTVKEAAYAKGQITDPTLLKGEKFIPNKDDIARAQVAKDIGIKGTNYSKNIKTADDAIKKEAENLKKVIGNKKMTADPKVINSYLTSAKSEATATLTSPEVSVYNKYLNKFNKILSTKGNNLEDLLQARKDFDAWAKEKNPNIFENARGGDYQAVKSVRDTINSYIDNEVKDGVVKASLKKQSYMFDIKNNLAETAGRGKGTLRSSKAVELIKKNKGKLITGGIAAGATILGLEKK